MPSSPDATRPGNIEDDSGAAECLLNSLIGVTAARVVSTPDGGVEGIHILTTSDHSPREVVESVLTALRAHLDLVIDPGRVSVARVREGVPLPAIPASSPLPPRRRSPDGPDTAPSRPPDPTRSPGNGTATPEGEESAPGGGTGTPPPAGIDPAPPAGEGDPRPTASEGALPGRGESASFPSPYREATDKSRLLDLFPPPWPERGDRQGGGAGSRSAQSEEGSRVERPRMNEARGGSGHGTGGRTSTDAGGHASRGGGDRDHTSEDAGRGRDRPTETRLVFLGHEATRRRAEREVRIGVDLEWLGDRFHGEATAPDEAGLRLAAPAEATLRAIEAAVAARPRQDVDIRLRLNGVELVEAFGLRHVMVSVHAEVDGRSTPLTGTLVVDESPELSTILATLQATDRSARAVLQNHMAWGPPRVGDERSRG